MTRRMNRNPARKITTTVQYILPGLLRLIVRKKFSPKAITFDPICAGCERSMSPNSLPRGTAWIPSSPPVNGACTAKKNIICASARVIIAK